MWTETVMIIVKQLAFSNLWVQSYHYWLGRMAKTTKIMRLSSFHQMPQNDMCLRSRSVIALILVKNMEDWVHTGHKTDPAVISAGLKLDCDTAPPPNLEISPQAKEVMTRSLEFLWAFGEVWGWTLQITREIFSLTSCRSVSLSALPPVCDGCGRLRPHRKEYCCYGRKSRKTELILVFV